MKPDELIVVSHIYDYGARVRSYEIVAELIDRVSTEKPPIGGIL
jgi:hypothetical protein